jgi:hypothetical protein
VIVLPYREYGYGRFLSTGTGETLSGDRERRSFIDSNIGMGAARWALPRLHQYINAAESLRRSGGRGTPASGGCRRMCKRARA